MAVNKIWNKKTLWFALLAVLVGLAVPAFGPRAWWVLPPAVFVILLTIMFKTGRQSMTFGWVLLAAGVAVVLGVFLRLT